MKHLGTTRIRIADILNYRQIRDAGKLQLMKRSVKTHGLVSPILVLKYDHRYVLIDGLYRLVAVQACRRKTIAADVLQ